MEEKARFCHLTVDAVDKRAYVWHEANWKFSDEWHAHHRGQLIYVEKGLQYLHTANQTYLLPTHHCAWIPPGMAHRTSSPVHPVYLRCLFFSSTGQQPFFENINVFNTPRVLREMILFTEQWSRLEKEDAVEQDFLQGLKRILPLSFKAAIPLVLPMPSDPRIKDVVGYLAENIRNEFRSPQIAARFNLTVRTMERLFKKDIGITFAGYQKLLKIIKAAELLSVNGETVKSVAFQVGYESVSTFSNTFFKVLGTRPQEMLSEK
ncbi:AraC family transcriptional regulator [Pedobacter nutrimenti]|uniref:AraC-like protein n=1 Tax=Pedobacter nutrimenti TaxID=1241337 RepID=A0A318UBL3_9SPHI|nr:helix-turn-helix transcriptional regulator [Pedobacter nutrimenti]PYF72933.1 AraC-like protein [Pedobacter nutrimenti]